MAQGWHPEIVKAEVRRRGITLTQLALDNDLSPAACRVALIRPFHRAEQAIAAFIGVPARKIWPDRYDPDGTPRHPHARSRHLKARATGAASQKHEAA